MYNNYEGDDASKCAVTCKCNNYSGSFMLKNVLTNIHEKHCESSKIFHRFFHRLKIHRVFHRVLHKF